jgi:cyclase
METLFKRIIPKIMLTKNSGLGLIGSITTKNYLPLKFVGSPKSQARIFESNNADELILLNIDVRVTFDELIEVADSVSKEIFMPLSVGGGIKTYEQAARIFELGVEKVVVENMLLDNPKHVNKIANRFGSQSIIGSCTYWGNPTSTIPENLTEKRIIHLSNLAERILLIENLGVGEIMINDASRDGTYTGSNIVALKIALQNTSLPIIDSCGFGSMEHFIESFKYGSSAVAVGSYFAFVDQSFLQLKNQIANGGIRVRE